MQAVIDSNQRYNEAFVETINPSVKSCERIVPCVSRERPCYTFVFAPNDTASSAIAREAAVIGGISDEDEEFGIRGFASGDDMMTWVADHPNTTQLGVIFENSARWASHPEEDFKYTLAVNETKICKELGVFQCNDPYTDYRAPLQTALDSAFIRLYGNETGTARIKAGISDFPHPDLPVSFYVMDEYGREFFYMVMVFNFVVQAVLVVMEKERKLKDAMLQMGMHDTAYWASWMICFTVMNTIMVLLLCLCGAICQLDFFLENNFFLYFFLFWLAAQAFTSFAMFFAAFCQKTSTVRSLALLFFVVSLLAGELIDTFLYALPDDDNSDLRRVFALIPTVPYYVGMRILVDASSGSTQTGMGWSDFDTNMIPASEDDTDEWSMRDNYNFLCLTWVMYAILAWYFDNVTPNAYGRRESIFFPVLRLWNVVCGRRWRTASDEENQNVERACVTAARVRYDGSKQDLDRAVQIEAEAVLDENDQKDQRTFAMKIIGLIKRFGSHNAVDNVVYGVDEGSLFCLLGHNGAGKTTTINMLTGNLSITDGDAFIFGKSVKNDMDSIRPFLGVCPQHDILWDQLTGKEHLELFARIKGIANDKIQDEVRARLEDVLLVSSANMRSSAYSGGMLRRLSLAIALLGDPRLVFLDEPTTGMDPVTRRDVWDMIQRAKRKRVIVLTTHSMEVRRAQLMFLRSLSLALSHAHEHHTRDAIYAGSRHSRRSCRCHEPRSHASHWHASQLKKSIRRWISIEHHVERE